MNINFSEIEMKNFLLKRGYILKKVKVWETHLVYHNQTEIEYNEIEIAYKEGKINDTILKDSSERYDTESKYGIKNVFEKKIKKALLKL